jgi:hypothetical protein
MTFYKHHRHTDAGQYVLVDVPPCHAGDLIPCDKQHQHMDGPQQIHDDVHDDSVRKNNKIFVKITITYFHENRSVENLFTKHGKKN